MTFLKNIEYDEQNGVKTRVSFKTLFCLKKPLKEKKIRKIDFFPILLRDLF